MFDFLLLVGENNIPDGYQQYEIPTSGAILLGFFLGIIATLFIVFLYSSIKEIIKNNNSDKDNNEDEEGD